MGDQAITSLIEKLEGAEGPSIALEAEICWTLERDRATSAYWRGAMGQPRPLPEEFARLPRGLGMASLEVGSPNYTASIDAALALAERVLPGVRVMVERDHDGTGWAMAQNNPLDPRKMVEAATPALALCAAIVRAHPEGS